MKTTIISLLALTAIALSGCSDGRGHTHITNNFGGARGWYNSPGFYRPGWFGRGHRYFNDRPGRGFFGRREFRR